MDEVNTVAPQSKRKLSAKRLLALVAIGLAAINIAQYAKGALAERVFAAERRAMLSPQATIDRFHVLFYNSSQTIGRNRWMGIPTEQNPNDVWITQEILFEVKPDFVVEAGAYMGGSAVLWAMILREVNPAGRVITIDIEDRLREAKELPIFKERVEFILGSSTAPEIVKQVKDRVAGHRVVLILDSNHRKDHVLKELRAYADIVEPGSYIIVQDSNINGHPVDIDPNGPAAYYAGQPGPMEAIEEFLPLDKRFVVDLTRERLLVTMNPKGFLRRVH
jgi:cephalosporin hydroxylase